MMCRLIREEDLFSNSLNYLGHLYFSGNNKSLMVANLYGDFIKGRDFSYLPEIIQQGVVLHREIDDFIDSHPLVAKLRLKLYESLPKVAGIAIDLYFDHLLAKDWENFRPIPLEDFVDDFFQFVQELKSNEFRVQDYGYSSEYIHLLTVMQENKWIRRYRNMEGLMMASSGLSQRISFPNDLAKAPQVFQENHSFIEEVFYLFMEDAVKYFGENENTLFNLK